MIILSLPRCGATRISMDISEKTGLPFRGEFHTTSIKEYGSFNYKEKLHETNCQPTFNSKEFHSILKNHKNNLLLINNNPVLLTPFANFVVLRKNLRDMLLSLAKFMLKINDFSLSYLKGIITHVVESAYGLLTYLTYDDLPIIWYETYFGISGTDESFLDHISYGSELSSYIESMIHKHKLQDLITPLEQNDSRHLHLDYLNRTDRVMQESTLHP